LPGKNTLVPPIKIMLCEDDAEKRHYLQLLLARCEGFDIVGAHGTGEAAVSATPALLPDVVLMDLNLPGISGIEATQRIKALSPETQVIMYTAAEEAAEIYAALNAGASGYLLKMTPPTRLAEAIREVAAGGTAYSPRIVRQLLALMNDKAERERQASGRPARRPALTERQMLIVQRLTEGRTYQQIAEELACSVETVRDRAKMIYRKMFSRGGREGGE
jgi:DNA-binding NarL/FixJ family response regulator